MILNCAHGWEPLIKDREDVVKDWYGKPGIISRALSGEKLHCPITNKWHTLIKGNSYLLLTTIKHTRLRTRNEKLRWMGAELEEAGYGQSESLQYYMVYCAPVVRWGHQGVSQFFSAPIIYMPEPFHGAIFIQTEQIPSIFSEGDFIEVIPLQAVQVDTTTTPTEQPNSCSQYQVSSVECLGSSPCCNIFLYNWVYPLQKYPLVSATEVNTHFIF